MKGFRGRGRVEGMLRKPKQKIPLEREKEALEQYASSWFDEEYIKEKRYAQSIGNFLILFSVLEEALNSYIARLENERSDDPGYRILKYLNFRNKIFFAKDLSMQIILFSQNGNMKVRNKKKLDIVISKLIEISEFRNKIAHANWSTLGRRGYVRVSIKENYEEGGIEFENIKITPGVINKFSRQVRAITDQIDSFVDEIWEGFHLKEKS